jgi:hypothetical protein
MLRNDAPTGASNVADPPKSSVYLHFFERSEWHEGCKAFHEGRGGDAYFD